MPTPYPAAITVHDFNQVSDEVQLAYVHQRGNCPAWR